MPGAWHSGGGTSKIVPGPDAGRNVLTGRSIKKAIARGPHRGRPGALHQARSGCLEPVDQRRERRVRRRHVERSPMPPETAAGFAGTLFFQPFCPSAAPPPAPQGLPRCPPSALVYVGHQHLVRVHAPRLHRAGGGGLSGILKGAPARGSFLRTGHLTTGKGMG